MMGTRCALVLMVCATPALAQLPPPPVPVENPLTEEKRVLGKILFWDEQLSSDGTISCGTCHQPGAAGVDPRAGVHPGPDGTFGTSDDIAGSPGVVRVDAAGNVGDPVFGDAPQVTSRTSMSTAGAAYVPEAFWDGRAGTTFLDPESGEISIAAGGALENQALGPILSDVEMAHEERDWEDVREKLGAALPLGSASDLPPDARLAIETNPSYPLLFQAAFGDDEITAERIAFAIATYERTLIPDQTPWDAFVAGDPQALTPQQTQGWNFFQGSRCSLCHAPPLFTDQSFRNVGVRPVAEDPGRQAVTGAPPDAGRFKVPTLRNVGLKPNFMHTGDLDSVQNAMLWYRPNNPQRSNDNLDPLLPVPVPQPQRAALVDFLTNGLTDPRVANESFPFDRPTLHAGLLEALDIGGNGDLTWPELDGIGSYRIYRGALADLEDASGDGLPDAGYGACVSQSDPDASDTTFVDPTVPAPGAGFFYLKAAVDAAGYEVGLGATHAGLPRWVAASCPPS